MGHTLEECGVVLKAIATLVRINALWDALPIKPRVPAVN